MNSLYPIYLRLNDRDVLLIGGGRVALRRLERILDAGAHPVVVSPEVRPEIAAYHRDGRLRWEVRRFRPEDLDGVALVFLAVGDPSLVEEVQLEAEKRGVLFNAAEDQASCDFHVPAVANVRGVSLAISTRGASPALAASLARRVETWLEGLDEETLDELRRRRQELQGNAQKTTDERAEHLKPPAEGLIPPAAAKNTCERGKVYLVGGGPGDPGLLTVRAQELLRQADVVFYDRLTSQQILQTIPSSVKRVYVGKSVGCAHRANIVSLMTEAARDGKKVVRLKGGDPVLFGRGGEEMFGLLEGGVEFAIVPGVSALCSVPESAGIPVTYRGIASELVVRSGHRIREDAPGSERPDLRREPTRDAMETTFVYFMAVGRLSLVVDELIAEGLPPSTPVAIVEKGTLPDQRVIVGELRNIVERASQETIQPPALIVAGNVVKFRRFEEFRAVLEEATSDQSRVATDNENDTQDALDAKTRQAVRRSIL